MTKDVPTHKHDWKITFEDYLTNQQKQSSYVKTNQIFGGDFIL